MPIYQFHCMTCHWNDERLVAIDERNSQTCAMCGDPLERLLPRPAPHQVRGRVVEGGGPDRFTADVLGMEVRDLPSGLRTK